MTAKQLDTISGFAVLIGMTQGVIPFVTRIGSLEWTPFWSLPRQLNAPLWWIASAAVVVVAFATVLACEARKRKSSVPTPPSPARSRS